MEVTLIAVPLEGKDELDDMLELYQEEFTAFEPLEKGTNGRYNYPSLEKYWQDGACHPFFILADGKPAGFILINGRKYVRAFGKNHSVAEFFVLPQFRRGGIGTRAARLVFERFPGKWQLMMHPKNLPSHAFWANAADYSRVQGLKSHVGPEWYYGNARGTVYTFKVV